MIESDRTAGLTRPAGYDADDRVLAGVGAPPVDPAGNPCYPYY